MTAKMAQNGEVERKNNVSARDSVTSRMFNSSAIAL